MPSVAYLVVNFGGPRTLEEVKPFLCELLTDQEVVRTPLPAFLHRPLFNYIAKKRSKKTAGDYLEIGGKSPIFDDTEKLAAFLRERLDGPVLTFHRYLPATHKAFIEQVNHLKVDEIRVLPLFPQFSYATTGSIAKFFEKHLAKETINHLRWIYSYSADPDFIAAHVACIKAFLEKENINPSETALLYSCHGLPRTFSCTGDPYQSQCEQTFRLVSRHFPTATNQLSYQSKFGPGEWLKPYTSDLSDHPSSWIKEKKQVVIIPLSFTSDHIETLFEIEEDYLPALRENNLKALRCPALNFEPLWLQTILKLCKEKTELLTNSMLVRQDVRYCYKKNSANCRRCKPL